MRPLRNSKTIGISAQTMNHKDFVEKWTNLLENHKKLVENIFKFHVSDDRKVLSMLVTYSEPERLIRLMYKCVLEGESCVKQYTSDFPEDEALGIYYNLCFLQLQTYLEMFDEIQQCTGDSEGSEIFN